MNKKTRVTIPFDPDKLLDVLVAKMSLQDLASKTGTSPADFVEWIYLERIPPRVLTDMVNVLDLDPITVGGILGDTPEETREILRRAHFEEAVEAVLEEHKDTLEKL